MRIQRITTDEATGSIIGDMYADIGSEWRIQDVRLAECMSDWANCLISLDRADSYTFHDHKRGRESRLDRNGSEVLIQLQSTTWPDGASCRLDYAAFRAEILDTLRHYRDQLEATHPEYPGTSAFRRKLSHVEAQLSQT